MLDLKDRVKEFILDRQNLLPRKSPDFFVVGASRSGTTYLHHLLNAHPDIFLPHVKEQHYFNSDNRYRTDLTGFRPFYKGYDGQSCMGEITPFYFYAGLLYDRNDQIIRSETCAIDRIHKHFPDAHIMVTLRNPFTRLISMYKKNLYQGKMTGSLQDVIKAEMAGGIRPNLLYRGRYDIHLKNVLSYFPKTKILIFEEWTQDPASTLNDLCGFLELNPYTGPIELLGKAQNENDRYRANNNDNGKDESIELDAATRKIVDDALMPACKYVEDVLGRAVNWEKPWA